MNEGVARRECRGWTPADVETKKATRPRRRLENEGVSLKRGVAGGIWLAALPAYAHQICPSAGARRQRYDKLTLDYSGYRRIPKVVLLAEGFSQKSQNPSHPCVDVTFTVRKHYNIILPTHVLSAFCLTHHSR